MANWNDGNQLRRHIAFQSTGSISGEQQQQQQGFTFLYDYFHDLQHHPFPGPADDDDDDEQMMMMKSFKPAAETNNKPLISAAKDNTTITTSNNNNNNNNQQQEMMMMMMRKRRLRSDQIDALETSFQEDVKLEPERKMKLSRDLGLHPRQVAVWFQNRRARWKAKQLERLYTALKQEFDIISREKQNLQQEVIKLKAKLDDLSATTEKQGCSVGYTAAPSMEETVESTSVIIQSSNGSGGIQGTSCDHQVADQGSYLFSIDDYNITSASLPYWGHV